MSKEDLALNNLQWLICHKTKPNQIIVIAPNLVVNNKDQTLSNEHFKSKQKSQVSPFGLEEN